MNGWNKLNVIENYVNRCDDEDKSISNCNHNLGNLLHPIHPQSPHTPIYSFMPFPQTTTWALTISSEITY